MEQQLTFFLALAVGLVFGGLAVWLMLRADTGAAYSRAKSELAAELSRLNERINGKDAQLADLRKNREQLTAELEKQRQAAAELTKAKSEAEARQQEAEKSAIEKIAVLEQAQDKLTDTFRALSAEALRTNNATFLDLAKTTLDKYQNGAKTDLEGRQKAIEELVKPLCVSLAQVDDNIREIEQGRAAAYAGISEQVKSLYEAQHLLRSETSNLVNALRTPSVRGRWGEIQLRRVVEMAGMSPYCDFEEQPSVETDDGRLRPDMLVRLPNERLVVVDAKVSLKAYLEALDATDEESRRAKLKEHATQIRAHLQRLGAKSYWNQFPGTPEFVVAFLPGEAFFSAALESDPSLIEFGVGHKVILATPTTLIALLKSVAYGWRQEKLALNARQISDLGKALYERLGTFTEHLAAVRTHLQRTVDTYNRSVGSLESRVLVSARRFVDLGAAPDRELRSVEPVDNFPRSLEAVKRAVSTNAAFELEGDDAAGADTTVTPAAELPVATVEFEPAEHVEFVPADDAGETPPDGERERADLAEAVTPLEDGAASEAETTELEAGEDGAAATPESAGEPLPVEDSTDVVADESEPVVADSDEDEGDEVRTGSDAGQSVKQSPSAVNYLAFVKAM